MVEKLISDLTALGATPAAGDFVEIETVAGASKKVTYAELVTTENLDALDALTAVAVGDKVIVRDVSDTTDGVTGTDKEVTVSNLKGAYRVYKTSDESRASDTTLAADSQLTVALATTTTYSVRGVVMTQLADATPDLKYGLIYSGTTTGSVTTFVSKNPCNNTTQTTKMQNSFLTSDTLLSSVAGDGRLFFEVTFTTSSTGNFYLAWAQQTSDVNTTTILKGSWIEYSVVQ